MNNYIDIFRLLEKKDHIIKKMTQLTNEQKQIAIDFFNKHPNLEKELGTKWNKPAEITWEDLESVIYKQRISKNQMKKASKSAAANWITEGPFFDTLYESDKFIIYQPLTYIGARYLASKDVAPYTVGEWCIAYQKDKSYWDEYSYSNQEIFLFVFTGSSKYALQVKDSILADYYDEEDLYKNYNSITVWNQKDITVEWEDFVEELSLTHKEEGLIYNLAVNAQENWGIVDSLRDEDEKVLKQLEENAFLEKKNLFYSKLKAKKEKGTPFIWEDDLVASDIVKFGLLVKEGDECYLSEDLALMDELKGNFTYNGVQDIYDYMDNIDYDEDYEDSTDDLVQCPPLTRLGGCPKKVTGWFDISYNKLKSLEGCPKYVGETFRCVSNELISLEGGPEVLGSGYYAGDNKLTNLKGAPKRVEGAFMVNDNALTSLEGAPEYVKDRFVCNENYDLDSLEYAPKDVGWFDCEHIGIEIENNEEFFKLIPNTKIGVGFEY